MVETAPNLCRPAGLLHPLSPESGPFSIPRPLQPRPHFLPSGMKGAFAHTDAGGGVGQWTMSGRLSDAQAPPADPTAPSAL